MRDLFSIKAYNLVKTSVEFKTEDEDLKWVFDECERLCKLNRKEFGDYNVLIEGAKYNGVWLETQPMGGEMYAKRDMEAALSNILIFMRYQRRDGRYPGMISFKNGWDRVTAHYDWMQGCFFADAALRMYYHLGCDKEYLALLYDSVKDFDEYLWKYRDSKGDGCLEVFCIWDTGEDNSTVHILNGVEYPRCGGWGKSDPPSDYGNMPYKSPQYMAYSYSCRIALAEMSAILNNGKEHEWREKAETVRRKAAKYLWNDERKAFFNRDKHGKIIDALTQENIKCMYHGLMTQEMADDFIRLHFMNENEFWTPYPLPSIALNDPYFHYDSEFSNCQQRLCEIGFNSHDIDNNSWAGPTNGLTYQRSIRALLNYNHHAEEIMLAERVLGLVKRNKVFVQNNNPLSGEYSASSQNGYGPMMLAVLEFISLMTGVNVSLGEITWTFYGDVEFEYTQNVGKAKYRLISKNGRAIAYINEVAVFEAIGSFRIKTDMQGNISSIFGIDSKKQILYSMQTAKNIRLVFFQTRSLRSAMTDFIPLIEYHSVNTKLHSIIIALIFVTIL